MATKRTWNGSQGLYICAMYVNDIYIYLYLYRRYYCGQRAIGDYIGRTGAGVQEVVGTVRKGEREMEWRGERNPLSTEIDHFEWTTIPEGTMYRGYKERGWRLARQERNIRESLKRSAKCAVSLAPPQFQSSITSLQDRSS